MRREVLLLFEQNEITAVLSLECPGTARREVNRRNNDAVETSMRMSFFTNERLLEILVQHVKLFYQTDRQLLSERIGERAVMFRLGARMLNAFQPAEVYAEYNKRHDPRTGVVLRKEMPELGKKTSAPDLTVFFNDPMPSPNLLVVEIKTSYSGHTGKQIENDKQKLKYFTRRESEISYQYHLGCHLFLDKDYFLIVCYSEGRPCSIFKYEYDCIHDSWTDLPPQDTPEGFEYRLLSDLNRLFPGTGRGKRRNGRGRNS